MILARLRYHLASQPADADWHTAGELHAYGEGGTAWQQVVVPAYACLHVGPYVATVAPEWQATGQPPPMVHGDILSCRKDEAEKAVVGRAGAEGHPCWVGFINVSLDEHGNFRYYAGEIALAMPAGHQARRLPVRPAGWGG